jgi:hypothetical protein
MWMFEVETVEGTRTHAYKHRGTRRYVHLDDQGRAFVYEEAERYRQVGAAWLLDLALHRGASLGDP